MTTSTLLLETSLVKVHDVQHLAPQATHPLETAAPALMFPYRGLFVRRILAPQAIEVVAEASQVLLVNAGERWCILHPVPGVSGHLEIAVLGELLAELVPDTLLCNQAPPGSVVFGPHRQRIDARAQVLVALLRHSLVEQIAETLEAESLALTLVRRALGPRTARIPGASAGRQKLVDRTKLVLVADLSRRWSLQQIADEVGVSAVYLTQVFQQVEGLPLYQYHLRLRLARALDLLADYADLSTLSQDLGFSSHSHFSAAFLQTYGRSPTAFRQAALQR